MSRHKKTRQEKVTADLRRQHFVYTFQNKNPEISSVKAVAIIPTYSYIRRDIIKTFTLTLSIVGFQIFLYFLLKNHILALPMVKY